MHVTEADQGICKIGGWGFGVWACYCTIFGGALLAREFYIEQSKFGQK